jgi:hypothetical protein
MQERLSPHQDSNFSLNMVDFLTNRNIPLLNPQVMVGLSRLRVGREAVNFLLDEENQRLGLLAPGEQTNRLRSFHDANILTRDFIFSIEEKKPTYLANFHSHLAEFGFCLGSCLGEDSERYRKVKATILLRATKIMDKMNLSPPVRVDD